MSALPRTLKEAMTMTGPNEVKIQEDNAMFDFSDDSSCWELAA